MAACLMYAKTCNKINTYICLEDETRRYKIVFPLIFLFIFFLQTYTPSENNLHTHPCIYNFPMNHVPPQIKVSCIHQVVGNCFLLRELVFYTPPSWLAQDVTTRVSWYVHNMRTQTKLTDVAVKAHSVKVEMLEKHHYIVKKERYLCVKKLLCFIYWDYCFFVHCRVLLGRGHSWISISSSHSEALKTFVSRLLLHSPISVLPFIYKILLARFLTNFFIVIRKTLFFLNYFIKEFF